MGQVKKYLGINTLKELSQLERGKPIWFKGYETVTDFQLHNTELTTKIWEKAVETSLTESLVPFGPYQEIILEKLNNQNYFGVLVESEDVMRVMVPTICAYKRDFQLWTAKDHEMAEIRVNSISPKISSDKLKIIRET